MTSTGFRSEYIIDEALESLYTLNTLKNNLQIFLLVHSFSQNSFSEHYHTINPLHPVSAFKRKNDELPM